MTPRWLAGILALLLLATAGLAQTQFDVLVLAMPSKYHYEYIPVAHRSFEEMARRHHFQLTWTSNPEVFQGDLKKFAAIVFLCTSAEELNEAQRQGFQAYVKAGGGVVLVHKAIATDHKWDWYERMIGRSFINHPWIQSATVRITDRSFPATFALPERWLWSDEWYVFTAPLRPDLHDILSVDESTYDPFRIWTGQKGIAMGKDHPVSWYSHYEGSRIFVSALGHNAELYTERLFLDHLYGGLWWAATGKGISTQ